MACTDLGISFSTVELVVVSPVGGNTRDNLLEYTNEPKYKLIVSEGIPINATRLEFESDGSKYYVKLGYNTNLTNLLADLDVNTISWQSGTTVRYVFNGTPDLSTVEAGDIITVTNSANTSNNGDFTIVAVNDGLDYIEIENPLRTDATDDEAADTTSVVNIFDGKERLFFDKPVGWNDLPCDEVTVTNSFTKTCTEDPSYAFLDNSPISVDSGVIVLDSYSPSDVDDAADPQYFGFTTISGDWYVLRISGSSYQYAFPSYNSGYTEYAAAWANRVTLEYKEYSDIAD